MKVALGSDLHLEFRDIQPTAWPRADVLILSGDIMVARPLNDWRPGGHATLYGGKDQGHYTRFRAFLKRASYEYQDVIWVAGNHEFYGGTFPDVYNWLAEEASRYSNIHFLQNSSVVIGGITFLGATLWTDMNKGDPNTLYAIKNMMNDFRRIKTPGGTFSPHDAVAEHEKTLEYFGQTLKGSGKYVVVTHHAPTALSVNPQYANEAIMNGGYYSDLSEFILDHPQIALWTHGHMHDPVGYKMGVTTVVCNPRGYPNYDTNHKNFSFQLIEI